MDYVVVDDDMENIRALSQAGFKVHTPVKIANYRKYFSSLPLEDFSDLIASYDGFSSGLGKLAGIDTPPSGYNTQHFQIPCI